MKVTSDKPTKPGIYLYKKNGSEPFRFVSISDNGGVLIICDHPSGNNSAPLDSVYTSESKWYYPP